MGGGLAELPGHCGNDLVEGVGGEDLAQFAVRVTQRGFQLLHRLAGEGSVHGHVVDADLEALQFVLQHRVELLLTVGFAVGERLAGHHLHEAPDLVGTGDVGRGRIGLEQVVNGLHGLRRQFGVGHHKAEGEGDVVAASFEVGRQSGLGHHGGDDGVHQNLFVRPGFGGAGGGLDDLVEQAVDPCGDDVLDFSLGRSLFRDRCSLWLALCLSFI